MGRGNNGVGKQLGSGRLGEVLFSTEMLARWEGQEDCCGCYCLGYWHDWRALGLRERGRDPHRPTLNYNPDDVILAACLLLARLPH